MFAVNIAILGIEQFARCVGQPHQPVEPIPPPFPVPNEFSGADYQSRPLSSNSEQSPPHPGLRRLVPVVVVLIVLTLVSSVFYQVHQRNIAKESGSAADPRATSGQPKLEIAGKPHMVHKQVRGVPPVLAAKIRTAQIPDTAKEDDPVELWKAVKRGNVSAEVALANLYLQGKSVPQNCEQAHMLLQAASTKSSKAADTLLASGFAAQSV